MKHMRRQSDLIQSARRRGSVMVLVLGLLALLALVGLALISRTHTDSRRAAVQSDATSIDDAMNGAIRAAADRLYQDIWGAINDASVLPATIDLTRPLNNMTPPGGAPTDPNFFGILENNESYDKPGEADRWLASLVPYYVGDITLIDPTGTTVVETDVLAYDNVSYLGQDLLLPPATASFLGSPFMWVDNARNPTAPQPLQYAIDSANTRSSLRGIPLLMTRAPGIYGITQENLPGATTNVTIRQGRDIWKKYHQAWLENVVNTGLPAGLRPQYPYFDTNRDGMPDLYDADGDGVPDSPISIVIPIDSGDPNRRKTLYAVIRIVDHNAMLNLNTASSVRHENAALTFNGASSDLTRRGRRAVEILIDGAVHSDDWLTNNRAGVSMDRRMTGALDPIQYDNDIVRRLLLGGQWNPNNYTPYDIDDESSLRHRGRLVRYDRQNEPVAASAANVANIDQGLHNTTQWSRDVDSTFAASYMGTANPRWNRLNSIVEDYDVGNSAGWRRLLDEDDPAFVRKPLLTTINGEVRLPPDITTPTMPTAPSFAPADPRDPNVFVTADEAIDARLRRLWAIGMNWPVLIRDNSPLANLVATEAPMSGPTPDSVLNGSLIHRFLLPTEQMPPAWARVLPLDLNMTFGSNDLNAQDVKDVKAEFIRYAAAAMYFALDGVNVYQGIDLRNNGRLAREYLAWQFALNLTDYRDADSIPTRIEWPTQPGVFITGVERQPFFTEAVAYLKAGAAPLSGPATGPGSGQPDKWFFGVELYVPPGWDIDPSNLYLRSPGTTMGLRPLAGFLNHQSGNALASENNGFMIGGPAEFVDPGDGDHGHYYVFTGPTGNEPSSLSNNDIAYRDNAYSDSQFRFATDGRGRIELVHSLTGDEADATNVVLDVIGPDFAGGPLASSTPNGIGRWAYRDPSIPENAERLFSLRRSTKGWRFTTAWHAYAEAPSNTPGGPSFAMSLGRPNAPLPQLVNKIPESVWPSLTPYGSNAALIDTFASGVPFEAFDSVADLSRQFIIGPVNRTASPVIASAFGNLSLGTDQAPATLVLAKILQTSTVGDLPSAPEDRVAAGRVDFYNASKVSGSGTNGPAWTWRLFSYADASGHLFDGVDNDDDGFIDLFDPTEAWDVLFKETGHVNMNTAPATVLRSVPSMSLLPNSPEILAQYGANPPVGDQIAAYANAAPGDYYDFASAVVALRENRDVPIRLYDNSQSRLSIAAIAQVTSAGGPLAGPGANASKTSGRDGSFFGPIEMSRLRNNKVTEGVNGANNMFAINRLDSNSALPLLSDQHLTPDYRVRPERGVSDYVAIQAPTQAIPGYAGANPAGVESDPIDAAGIRGRDIYLSRVSNLLTTRSDVFTAYIALIDEDGNYVRRAQVTMDRSPCFRDRQRADAVPEQVQPKIVLREDSSYTNDTK